MSKTLHRPVSTQGLAFILILSALMAFTSLSVDIYLPAMPMMSASLHGNTELTITGFLIGFCLAQLVWGPISDRYGRRLPLLIGMTLFIVGSIGCALSQTIAEIVFWRVFQAIGACTGPMLARAMIRDLFSRTRAAQMLSTLIVVMAIAPIAGPIIGGQLILFTSWHAIFWLLAIIGIAMWVALRWLPETLAPEQRIHASLCQVFRNYYDLLKQRQFMRFTLALTFYYVSAYTFITASPFVYINYFHVSAQHFGYYFAVNIVGVMGMSILNRRLVHRFALEKLLKFSVTLSASAMVLLAVTTYFSLGGIGLMMGLVFIFFAMNGVIASVTTAAALDSVPRMTGAASALIGSLQYGSGILSSALLAIFNSGTPLTMALMMASFTLTSFVMSFLAKD
ncbi:Bcr/CflA family multidrug efflux MFS transporter [Rosenbergiella collisarenosi]|uniref:Bcr/CflA family multidrug efflux MFS transporter n=1 Tax=Rosenbergiella collisarenosi TaxID=1544695 RepID=UPI001BD9B4CC|nr:Bcr/CflA family multidrug efflux MFS transporter [Rosenbergiella collisarenosi]MBT0719909.1 Bcr/CflA family multidrug efflux MFS transporter [Rosenbergiella collisarenosi]